MGRTSILDGLDVGILQARLASLQQAYLDLSSGARGETYSYTQGEGAKSVTYTRANLGDLTQAILLVQTQIDRVNGVRSHRRAPMRPYF
jgi:hypothetical protein